MRYFTTGLLYIEAKRAAYSREKKKATAKKINFRCQEYLISRH